MGSVDISVCMYMYRSSFFFGITPSHINVFCLRFLLSPSARPISPSLSLSLSLSPSLVCFVYYVYSVYSGCYVYSVYSVYYVCSVYSYTTRRRQQQHMPSDNVVTL